MQDVSALQNRVLGELLKDYDKYKDAISFDDMILLFFEASLIHFAKQRREVLKQRFSGCFCSDLLNREIRKESCREVLSEAVNKVIDTVTAECGYSINDIGILFEFLTNLEYTDDKINESIQRSDNGMYFSNPSLVHNTLGLLLKNVGEGRLPERTFIDPAMGAGVFLLELLELVRGKVSRNVFREFIRKNVYGVDKNPIVVDIFKVIVYIRYLSDNEDLNFLAAHFRACDSLLTPVRGKTDSWEALFPDVMSQGGFHYVIGNPPWGKIKSNIREYHLLSGSLTKEAQGAAFKRKAELDTVQFQKWEDYQEYIKGYSQKLKASKEYYNQQYIVDKSTTGGDADLYKYFLELSYHLLRENGYIGYIIPASFYMSEGSTGLRHLLLENGTIEYLLNFENKKHIFPIHSAFKFIVLIYHKNQKAGSVRKAAFDLTDIEDIAVKCVSESEYVSYSRNFLKRCSGSYWSIPECRNNYERALLGKLYQKHRFLGAAPGNSWNVSFNREFDMTLDSELFIPLSDLPEETGYFPLYEGRMVSQYNSSKKRYVRGAGRTAVWVGNENSENAKIHPQYYLNEENCRDVRRQYRAAYCEITGQKNKRTVLASLIVPNAVCGNKVPTITFSPSDRMEYHLYWIGVANSFVIDWIIRKKITITLNFYHWMQTPFPRLPESEDRFKKIAAWSALALELVNGYRIRDEIQDAGILDYMDQFHSFTYSRLRMEIDLAVAELFDLSPDEMLCVMYGFPSIDSGCAGINGDKRYHNSQKCSYVTRDLLIYETRKRAKMSTDVSVADLYESIGIDIRSSTGEIENLRERMAYYREHGCRAYDD